MTELLDLTPRFRTFHAAAQGAEPERRWALWQDLYGVAAVPPTPQGQRLARELLDAAWDRYGKLPDDLSAQARRLHSQDAGAAARPSALLGAPVPSHRLVAYVGGFEDNAFAFSDPLPTVCLPVETAPEKAEVFLTHELAHLVHHALSGGAGGWTRTLGATIVQEGLATRVTDALHPGAPLAWRIGEAGWLAAWEVQRVHLLADALPRLSACDDATTLRFILPHPELTLERGAYALGWWLAGEWLAAGRTLAALARVPERELPALVQTWLAR
ncbi:hypothetical protein [Deinococcus budaensis]|uniref:DUF2268 domain-containing protein n=1 Tax=Deinococcus budaensis TaxID=1665626 RepID=A0A7W8GHK3_9DEIO|nr:hypothetical protein [Deinococcus budaensis]MBB5235780.1 hypothetical protein [Deinococcus budaensis]